MVDIISLVSFRVTRKGFESYGFVLYYFIMSPLPPQSGGETFSCWLFLESNPNKRGSALFGLWGVYLGGFCTTYMHECDACITYYIPRIFWTKFEQNPSIAAKVLARTRFCDRQTNLTSAYKISGVKTCIRLFTLKPAANMLFDQSRVSGYYSARLNTS